MKNKIQKLILRIITLAIVVFLTNTHIFAAPILSDPTDISGLTGVFVTLVNTGFWVSGGVFLIMLFIASVKYAMSQGDPKGLEGAQQALTYAIFGFLVAISFFAITKIAVENLGLDTRVLNPGRALETALQDLKNMLDTENPYSDSYTSPGSNMNRHQPDQYRSTPDPTDFGGYGSSSGDYFDPSAIEDNFSIK